MQHSNEAVPASLTQPPTDVPVGSPEWWVYQLDAELATRSTLTTLYEDYFEGRHALNFATATYREAYSEMLAAVNDNWIPLVIGMSVERLVAQGFTFSDGPTVTDEEADDEALRIWQDNSLDADSALAFTEACKHGESYMLVWPEQVSRPGIFGRWFRRRSQVEPKITVEHPAQMVVRRAAGDRRRRSAAMKKWIEDDGTTVATLYLPDSIHYFQMRDYQWVARDGRRDGGNDLGVVPVVPIVNEPHMLPCRPPKALMVNPHRVNPAATVGLGRSDQADIITTVDQIDKLVCDMMVASEFAAFRQRWATGLDVGDEDEEGKEQVAFKAAVDRLWAVPASEHGDEVKFGEFQATELKNYTDAIESRVQSLAARTRTPPHYLLGGMANLSGEALQAAETALASKVRGKQKTFGEGLEEAMRLAFAIKGDESRAMATSVEINWAPAETRSESEYMDSLVKKMSLGIPLQQLWEDAGYSPQKIRRFKRLLLEQAVMQLGDQTNDEPDADEPAEPSAN